MKIVQVTPRYPPRTGGVETHVQEISERLVDRGHDVTVITADAGDTVESHTIRNGVEIRRYRGFAPSGAFHVAPQIALAVRRTDADVVHAHNYHSLPMYFAALAISNERFIVTPHYHGASSNRFRQLLLQQYRPIGGWAIRQADEVIAVSRWEQDRLLDDFGVDATHIPNGVDVERFTAAEPEKRQRPYILCVGRLEEYKGVQYVIRALNELPEYDLVIAGSGPYGPKLEEFVEAEGVSDRVEFLGFVDADRLPGLYAGADVYVTLSQFEAYGMTVAEALAVGTPCLVREQGALQDWGNKNGVMLIDRVDPDTIMDAIRRCRNLQVTDSPYSWEEVTERTLEKYQA